MPTAEGWGSTYLYYRCCLCDRDRRFIHHAQYTQEKRRRFPQLARGEILSVLLLLLLLLLLRAGPAGPNRAWLGLFLFDHIYVRKINKQKFKKKFKKV